MHTQRRVRTHTQNTALPSSYTYSSIYAKLWLQVLAVRPVLSAGINGDHIYGIIPALGAIQSQSEVEIEVKLKVSVPQREA